MMQHLDSETSEVLVLPPDLLHKLGIDLNSLPSQESREDVTGTYIFNFICIKTYFTY